MKSAFINMRQRQFCYACPRGRDALRSLIGDSHIDVTYEMCLAYARLSKQPFDFAWAAHHLIGGRRGQIAHTKISGAIHVAISRGDDEGQQAEEAAYQFYLAWQRGVRALRAAK